MTVVLYQLVQRRSGHGPVTNPIVQMLKWQLTVIGPRSSPPHHFSPLAFHRLRAAQGLQGLQQGGQAFFPGAFAFESLGQLLGAQRYA